jgi:hypothetical protein
MEETPFSTIESAEEFLQLLQREVGRARGEIHALAGSETEDQPRRDEALRLVEFKLNQLSRDIGSAQRHLHDLKTLRTLLLRQP